MTKDLINDPCIPTEYKDSYEHYSFHALCQNAITCLQIVAKNRMKIFNLKEVLGDCMLGSPYCDYILSPQCILHSQHVHEKKNGSTSGTSYNLNSESPIQQDANSNESQEGKKKIYGGNNKHATVTF